MRNRRVPQRTCIVCGTKTSKRDLYRIVRTPEGACVVDETGRRAGRGAYLCGAPACWEGALRRGRLAAALRGEIDREDRERLEARAAALAAGATAGSAH